MDLQRKGHLVYTHMTQSLPDPTTMSGFPTVTVAVKSSPLNSASPCQLTNFCCCV